MLATGIDTVLVFVTDIERSLAFYTEVLELPLMARHGDFATLRTAGAVLALHATPSLNPQEAAQRTVVSLTVADYAAAKTTLEGRGCVFTFENQTPNAVFGTFADPDGTQLQIIQRK